MIDNNNNNNNNNNTTDDVLEFIDTVYTSRNKNFSKR